MNFLVMDIGGTFIKYAHMDELGTIDFQDKVKTPLSSFEEFWNVMDQIVDERFDGIAVSFPGPVDAQKGMVIHGGSLSYMKDFPFVKEMQNRYQTFCAIENDARCAALAEVWKGNLKDIPVGMAVVFGTGIGSSIVINGKLFKGAHFFSGEISCMLTRDQDQLGWQASFHHEAGVPFLLEKVKQALELQELNGEQLFQLIENQNETAVSIFQTYCKTLAKQFYNLQCVIDPQRICIGGGISQQPLFIEGLKQAIHELTSHLPVKVPEAEILPCKFHNDSNLIGALYHFQQNITQEE